MLRIYASIGLLALLTACASSQSSPGVPSGTSSSLQRVSPASGSCCNIFWNKASLNLDYGQKKSPKAVLKYWGPNGYFFTPIYCEHGSQISVITGRTWGDPSAYEYTRFSFKAESSGPDSCQLIAWLQNTGSPPVSVINLYIKK